MWESIPKLLNSINLYLSKSSQRQTNTPRLLAKAKFQTPIISISSRASRCTRWAWLINNSSGKKEAVLDLRRLRTLRRLIEVLVSVWPHRLKIQLCYNSKIYLGNHEQMKVMKVTFPRKSIRINKIRMFSQIKILKSRLWLTRWWAPSQMRLQYFKVWKIKKNP